MSPFDKVYKFGKTLIYHEWRFGISKKPGYVYSCICIVFFILWRYDCFSLSVSFRVIYLVNGIKRCVHISAPNKSFIWKYDPPIKGRGKAKSRICSYIKLKHTQSWMWLYYWHQFSHFKCFSIEQRLPINNINSTWLEMWQHFSKSFTFSAIKW